MTFPLGSIQSEGAAAVALKAVSGASSRWTLQLRVVLGGALWLLWVLALLTHDAGDAAFSTSGNGGPIANKIGLAGAWVSDVSYVLFGYSAWWCVVFALRECDEFFRFGRVERKGLFDVYIRPKLQALPGHAMMARRWSRNVHNVRSSRFQKSC